ncbi:MAG: lipocalin family protein [Pseudorhodobacter sp.]
MHKLIALALLLSACATAPTVPGYRKPGSDIWSNAVLETGRLAGDWQQAADFAPRGTVCTPGSLSIRPEAGGLQVAGRLCLGGVARAISGRLTASGPGRFRPSGPGFAGADADWWVIWVDTNYRSLVIGTPSGAFGFALDRGGALPPDRRAAAREILDWNGYDLTRAVFAQ